MKQTKMLVKAGNLIAATTFLLASAVRAETLASPAPAQATVGLPEALTSFSAADSGATGGASSFFGLTENSVATTNPYVLFADVLSAPSSNSNSQSNVAALVVRFDAVSGLDAPGPVPLPRSFGLLLAGLGAVTLFGRKRAPAGLAGGNLLWRCSN